eukprot:TRINITY_DN508_c0_g2_i1.p1 TRINITY_DN508_c0_g2~~TRINITY_DN508_c0_g2_i1.p1  ORF type:complete len:371 (+),score=21.91 TRINITY_DN508_c0_g2_i1:676-1788(+)
MTQIVSPFILFINVSDQTQFSSFVFTIGFTYDLETVPCNEKTIGAEDSLSCSYVNEEDFTWSDEGCKVLKVETLENGDRIASCECTHLTGFAILQNSPILTERCNVVNIVGNYIWIVEILCYFIVWCFASLELHDMCRLRHVGDGYRFWIHICIFVIAIVNILKGIVLLIAKPDESLLVHVEVLFSLWALSYILSFFVFTLLVYIWANVCYQQIQSSQKSYIGNVTVIVVVFFCVSLILSFVLTSLSDRQLRKTGAVLGNSVNGAACILMLILYLIYGRWLSREIETNCKNTGETNMLTLARRITFVTRVLVPLFFTQSVLIFITGLTNDLFLRYFTVFESLIFASDCFCCILSCISLGDISKIHYDKQL